MASEYEYAEADAADSASAEEASSCRPGGQGNCSPPPGPTPHITEPCPSSSSDPQASSTEPSPESSSATGRFSFPILFRPIFFQRSNAPSASLAASTAEGKPAPLTDTTDAHPTSALHKLNSKYPFVVRRPSYTEAAAAQNSTYSQPVLVRTYSGPSPSRGSRSTRSTRYRPPSSGRGVSSRVPLPSSSAPGSGGLTRQPIEPTISDVGVGTTSSINGGVDRDSTGANVSNFHRVSMSPTNKAKKASSSKKLSLPWQWYSRQGPEEPKLPPVEAFSFKSFMADFQARGGDNDIGADLDRIAEICARSRYSLSNQYEVHVAPHGSGASFASGTGGPSSASRRNKGHSRSHSSHETSGPTLQAISSADEGSARSYPRRRNGGRRRSTAYGTLETIMSSSRSSEEEKSKKKPAAELVSEVRGRAARRSASGSASAANGNSSLDAQASQQPSTTTGATVAADPNRPQRRKSSSFATAVIDSGRSSAGKAGTSSSQPSSDKPKKPPVNTTSALLSEPALPQTSASYLGVRTAPGPTPRPSELSTAGGASQSRFGNGLPRQQSGPSEAATQGASSAGGASGPWNAWIPWRVGQTLSSGQAQAQSQGTSVNGAGAAGAGGASHAEGSLRQLLTRSGGLDVPAERDRGRAQAGGGAV